MTEPQSREKPCSEPCDLVLTTPGRLPHSHRAGAKQTGTPPARAVFAGVWELPVLQASLQAWDSRPRLGNVLRSWSSDGLQTLLSLFLRWPGACFQPYF